MGFTVHVYADKSNPEALQADLPGAPPGTWPMLSAEHTEEPPDKTNAPMNWVLYGMAGGWIEGEGHEVVTRPSGKAREKWLPTLNAPAPHTFHHFSHLTIAGVKYRVTHQPDKYADDGDGNYDNDTPVTDEIYDAGQTRVDWFYGLEKVSDG